MVSVVNRKQLDDAIAKYKREGNVNDWIIMGYSGPNAFEYKSEGTGTASMVSKLLDNEVAYILIRVQITESDPGFKEGVLDNKANLRDVFINWTGPSVGIIEKGKKKSHVGDAKALFQPFHSEITAVNRTHFNDATIKDRSAPLSGSHIID
eukprot:gene10059-12331_t